MSEPHESGDAYRDAGVDIDAGEALVERIKPLAKATSRPGVIGGLGGFGGLFALDGRWRDPVLVSGTDGVGTKLLLAELLGRFDTVGIDLVAMCVNDVVCAGAEPVLFLDYLATGKLDVDAATDVIAGIARGCTLAGCALLGGETAEMPGMYEPGRVDVAGFCVGIAERDQLLDGSRVQLGDALIGLPSSGVHSNGYSLVRKLLVDLPDFDATADPADLGQPLGDALMAPTRIYVREVLQALAEFDLHAAAHITGGGLPGNVPRVLADGLGARINRSTWQLPPIFRLLQQAGDLTDRDLFRTFNCGIGMVLVVPQAHATAAAQTLGGVIMGEVTAEPGMSWA